MPQSDRPDSPPERPRELSTEEKAELRTGTTIKNWINTDGWKIYKTILEAHLAGKRLELEAPVETRLDGMAQALRSEAAKGAIMGLRLALSIPEGIINNDKILRKSLGLAASQEEDDD
jgi:hypothetical protein